ncbi:MAG: flagellar FliL protein [Rhodobacteraceae bacterium HLUCCA24]|nr:MAG: flagellar FliL protein [Rhodobacteraceae bacterium HLUCCA24]
MSDASETGEPRGRGSRLPMVLGVVLAVAGGAAGFISVREGLLPLPGDKPAEHAAPGEPVDDVAFVPLDPIVVSLAPAAAGRHLRFTAELEVPPAHRGEVEALRPRVVDVLNGYLRALDETDLEAPGALVRLRAQMLRRVQMVTGEGRVRDLLVMEFVMT